MATGAAVAGAAICVGLVRSAGSDKVVRMQTLNVRDILYVLTAAAATRSR